MFNVHVHIMYMNVHNVHCTYVQCTLYILYKNIIYLMYIFMCAYNIISILWACVREGKYIHIYMCMCI